MSVGRVCSDMAMDCGERALVGFGRGGAGSDVKGLGIQLCIEEDFAEEEEGGASGGEEGCCSSFGLGGGLLAS